MNSVIIIQTILYLLVFYCISLLVKWVFNYIKNIRDYWHIKSRSSVLPLIGHLHHFKNDGADMLKVMIEMSNEFTDETVFKFFRGIFYLLYKII